MTQMNNNYLPLPETTPSFHGSLFLLVAKHIDLNVILVQNYPIPVLALHSGWVPIGQIVCAANISCVIYWVLQLEAVFV